LSRRFSSLSSLSLSLSLFKVFISPKPQIEQATTREEKEKRGEREMRGVGTLMALAALLMVALVFSNLQGGGVDGQSLVDDEFWPQMSEEELDKLEVVKPDISLMSTTAEDEHDAVQFHTAPPDPQHWPPGLVERLATTNAINMDEVLRGKSGVIELMFIKKKKKKLIKLDRIDMKIPWKYFPEKPLRYTMNNPYWRPHRMEGWE